MSTTIEPTPTDETPQQPETAVRRTVLWWLLGALLVVVVFIAVRLVQGYPLIGPRQLHGFVMNEPAPVGDFTLTSHNGDPVSLSDFRGKLVLLYFGYTSCPDVCPMTMVELTKARESLPERFQDDVQVLMVTVDPERDTPALLANYLSHFDETFLGLTGTPEEIEAAAAPLGIFYEKRVVEDSETYFMDHTATVAVVDRQGRLRLVWPFGMPVEDVASDLGYLVRE
ncbi:MAG: SCO family protein [Anaerolineales bacterium]|nr:SCO family protein [Anaerolineales bacterium]